ncbi:MAG: response regulator [Verrucomicrobia bacterium]|nr:response regulator [Verrucomicrobiota bacterium]
MAVEGKINSLEQQGFVSQTAGPLAHDLPQRQKNVRILLLEDMEPDAELMQRELRKAQLPFCARRVETREDFLRALQEFQPDIILSDFSMPQFTALEALRLLHASPYDVPFILVTGSQSEEVAVECMKEGVDDYILKTSLIRLPSAVGNALRKKEAERQKERASDALRQSEEHFRSLIENALDIIAVLNVDGTIRYASPSVKVLGYRPEELISKSLIGFVSPDDAQGTSNIFYQILTEAGHVRKFEFLFRHRDGSWRVLEAIGKSIHAHTENLGLVINARDVTERKEAETAIEKLAVFPRLNPNPIFELSSESRLNYFNQAAADMATLLGKVHPSEILPSDTGAIAQECLATGKSNLRRETTVGNRILSWSFFPIIPLQVVHCYAMDITERVHLETQLRQSQKMESIGQLAAGVAHDFNNILTLVQGYAGLLLAEPDLTPEMTESLQQISTASERAANLTRQLLVFSRKQMMQTQELDLNEVINTVAGLLRRLLREDVTLHFHYAPELPRIQADSGMIEQILMNLVVNARDAMPRGGRISVGTSTVQINEEHVRANPEARVGKYVCLRVSDVGAGIPQKLLTRIFEPFFTTKEVGKGTGLGLATVYGIVKQHQGWIEVLSQMDEGTTFHIFLPAMAQASVPEQPAPTPEKISGGSEKILIVEDEPDLRALVREILKHYGYEVLEAGSGPEALPIWQKHADEIDLLLTDLVMPGNMTGRELADNLLKQRPELKVIYTSGYSVETLGKDLSMKRGINFLPKPYQPITLVKMVRDCLDARRTN